MSICFTASYRSEIQRWLYIDVIMKVVFALLVLLPLIYCASIEERFILDSFGLSATDIAHKLQSLLGSDTSLAACESACPSLVGAIPGASLLCNPACVELQHLIQG